MPYYYSRAYRLKHTRTLNVRYPSPVESRSSRRTVDLSTHPRLVQAKADASKKARKRAAKKAREAEQKARERALEAERQEEAAKAAAAAAASAAAARQGQQGGQRQGGSEAEIAELKATVKRYYVQYSQQLKQFMQTKKLLEHKALPPAPSLPRPSSLPPSIRPSVLRPSVRPSIPPSLPPSVCDLPAPAVCVALHDSPVLLPTRA